MKYLFARPEHLVCSFTGKMGYMHYADELVKEFLVFRGFTNTLQTFETELSTDIGKGFQVDKILDLIFLEYVPKFQTEKLVGLLGFLKQYYSASIDTVFLSTLSKLEVSILRYFIIHALQSGRKEKVIEFFASNGNNLLLRSHEWVPWFAIPYLKSPNLDPQFRIYFSKEWLDAVHLSTRNFLSEMFNGTLDDSDPYSCAFSFQAATSLPSTSIAFEKRSIPALLKISTEKSTIKHLKKDIKQLNLKLSQLQALLEEKEAQICQLRSASSTEVSMLQRSHSIYSPTGTRGKHGCETNYFPVNRLSDVSSQPTANELEIEKCDDDYVKFLPELTLAKSGHDSSSSARLFGDWDDNLGEMQQEIEFPEVKVDFQETFLGHTSPISRSRFSASGNNIASASLDGTVRIWTYDSSTPSSRNATIYCGAEIMSLDWECKSDRLLLIGTADSGIKAWNVDAKRVVCDLSTTPEFPSILDLKCSPVEPIFVSAAASRRNVDQIGLASLTVWNMKTWKAMTVLPLGEDPPAITSLCFNHNGKILAASATDGMIHMFDMAAGLQITGWPAHDAAISSVLFGHDETSIFSLGYDGKIFEWSLHNQGQVLWSRDGSRFCKQDTSRICRHEMAMDANGTRLLATSGSVRSPIYQVQGHTLGLRTLPHSAAITTVDWHPTLPIYLTGSADHSVRVTSIS